METVGVVGFGAMGSALFERLCLSSVNVLVYDLSREARDRALAQGASVVTSAAELAGSSDVIDVIVRTDEDVMNCAFGSDGVLDTVRPNALLLLHSSIHPNTTLRIAESGQQLGVTVLDATAMGTPPEVRAGNLSWLVGGDERSVDRARPHLARMAKQIFHMGPLGSGNVAKLVANLIHGSERLIVYEALQIASAGGIRYTDLLETLRQIPHAPLVEHWEEAFDPSGNHAVPNPGTNMWSKDMPLAYQLSREYGLELPITQQLIEVARKIVANQGEVHV
jgi:3-hydroxyisobutyrate dehydrogenase